MTPIPLPRTFLRPIAHRGLHDTDRGVIENTGPAFSAAITGGFGIECDLRPAAGGLPLVFHDETLERLIDGTGVVAQVRADDVARLRYRASDAPILTFDALLALVGGAVPLLVEIKSEWDPPDAVFLARIAASAQRYGGPLALMSFDPDVVGRLADLAPAVPRGLVSGSYMSTAGDGWWADRLSPQRRSALRDMAEFDRVGASFCAYEVAAMPTPTTSALRARAIPVFTWTVRTPTDRHIAATHADAAIFEGPAP
jgi:glycerophosphoryl diester phosphodiesterase